ncbi:unnamed protein product [Linum trigynum]|uniref:Uncharacterized protein n=1 Tax=Linum trigynum TaxID=586398 RepID=A0AAV2E1C6_9ROSI
MRELIFQATPNRQWPQVRIEGGFHCLCLSTGEIQSLGGSVYLFYLIENETNLFSLLGGYGILCEAEKERTRGLWIVKPANHLEEVY